MGIDEKESGHRRGMRLTRAARWIAKAGRALATPGARRHPADGAAGMTAEERFLFDLEGYLVLRQVLGAAEVAALNAIADTRAPALSAVHAYDRVFRASAWGPPYRALIDHPRIVPYLVALVGTRFRLDHDYCIFTLTGGRGPDMHGGTSEENPDHWYAYRDGVMRSGLTVVTYCLTAAAPGDGGFCCIPGSHKSHFVASLPEDVRAYRRRPHYVVQPALEPGDAVIFTEALVHGTAPWTARHERRALLYKYSPGHSAWMGAYYDVGDYPGLTERQRRILAPPSVGDRPPSVPGR